MNITQEMESKIGLPPFSGDGAVRVVNHDMRLALRAWLISRGFDSAAYARYISKDKRIQWRVAKEVQLR